MTLRCLWLGRVIPYPVIAGDRLYTGRLVQAFASAGAEVRFIGLDGGQIHPPTKNIEWVAIPGAPYGQIRGLFSTLPLVAARHRTSAFVKRISEELRQPEAWDILVIDQYGMGWVLDLLPKGFREKTSIVFISHDHEESVMKSLWKNSKPAFGKKAFLLMNYLKTRSIERRVAVNSHLITTITDADSELFLKYSGARRTVTLTPGYSGSEVAARRIDASIPRRIILFGGLQWSAKQENLRLFLDAADQELLSKGIQAEIVGDVPQAFGADILARYKCVSIVGYVKDPAPYLAQARLGVIAEPIGGGFKMKILDYIFSRVPILTLEDCATGIPPSVLKHVFVENDLANLVRRLTQVIDDEHLLNDAQNGAFEEARTLFNWNERGISFLNALKN